MKDRSFRVRGDGKKAVLLLHGLTGAPGEMKAVGRVLHKQGFGLYAPLLAGHGGTESDLLRTGWRDWVASARAAYLDLAREVDDVYVAGICAGGAIGLELCAEFPQIRGAAVYSMLFEYDGWNMPKITMGAPVIQAVANLPLIRRISFVQPHPYGLKDLRLRTMASQALQSMIPGALERMPLGCMYQLYRLARHVEQVAPSVRAPVLIVHAREDDMSDLRNAERLRAALGGPSELLVLEDSYHMVHVDKEHGRVGALTGQFFGAPASAAAFHTLEPVDA
jgi:carboxylesterase